MRRSQNWLASTSVCRPGILDNVPSDMEGRVVCNEKTTCSDTRQTLLLRCRSFCQCCKDRVLSATERRRNACAGRVHELAFVATEAFDVASRWLNGSLVGALQAPSISKSSGAMVRHFVLHVDPIFGAALGPCETRVVDSRCWCADWQRLRRCGCVAISCPTCLLIQATH